MASKGRPRLSPDELRQRIDDYCRRYGASVSPEGLPPFPTGRRETRQHREWIAVYKAHRRLARRERGQCERCDAPVTDGSVLCEGHQDAAASQGAAVSLEDRRSLLAGQRGRCPVCDKKVTVTEDVDRGASGKGQPRGLVHRSCARLVGFAEEVGPEGLDRIRRYVWPRS